MPQESTTRVALMQKEFDNGRRTLVVMVRNEKPVLDALETQEPIKVDGILDEPTWSEGKGAFMVTKMGENTPHRSFVLARHDGRNLYFDFVLHEERMDKLKVTGHARDFKNIWQDDCVEIYLYHPNGKGWQFIVSPGAVWDAEILPDQSRRLAWDSGIVVSRSIQGKRFVLEMSIPLAVVQAERGSSFKANFYRSRVVDEGQSFSCWSPTFTEKHDLPERFGILNILPVK